MIAWMFPGQGSQRASMALHLASARKLLGRAGALLDAELESLCTDESVTTWPPELLQPAIYTTCLGAARALFSRGLVPDAVVGHSLGELTALAVARVFDFETGLRIVDVRGRAMAAAGRRHPGGMAAVIGLDRPTIEEICTDVGHVWVANLNSPSQTVISGKHKSLAKAARLCLEAGAARVIKLEVPVAAHSLFMEPAARELETALQEIEFKKPVCPIYSVLDGKAHEDPEKIRRLLVEAITSPVRFGDTVSAMHADGASFFVEVGPGRALRNLVRQTISATGLASVATDEEAETLQLPEGAAVSTGGVVP